MNDIARLISTVVIWLTLGTILVFLTIAGNDELSAVAFFLVMGAIASMGIVWQHAGKQADTVAEAEARTKAKRSERLVQRLAEEELEEEDIVTLEELLEEQRAARRLQDS